MSISAIDMLGASSAGRDQEGLPKSIRAVAYHHTDRLATASLRRQFDYFRRHYRGLVEDDLDAFFVRGERGKARKPAGARGGKPGLIISFDDGLVDHYVVAAPLLEEYGFRGWFFVPAALPPMAASEQRAFCEANGLFLPPDSGERIGMNREELLDLARRGHVVGCHTMNHRRFSGLVDAELIDRELTLARDALRTITGAAPRSFAWVGGEPDTYHPLAQEALKKEGFSYAFTTLSAKIRLDADPLMLHRTVLDADMPYPLFLAKVEGFSDLTHLGRRKALEARLGRPRARGTSGSSTEEKA
ncbi:polysaccharide deacetylase family protein [bacterium]|nr:polysaccharide deacetylase family protein [bacterium]